MLSAAENTERAMNWPEAAVLIAAILVLAFVAWLLVGRDSD